MHVIPFVPKTTEFDDDVIPGQMAPETQGNTVQGELGKKEMTEWDVSEVVEFVQSELKTDKYNDTLRRECVAGKALCAMSAENLKDHLGFAYGHSVQLIEAIEEHITASIREGF